MSMGLINTNHTIRHNLIKQAGRIHQLGLTTHLDLLPLITFVNENFDFCKVFDILLLMQLYDVANTE